MSRRPSSTRPPLARVCVLAAALAVTVGCSLKTMAVKTVANTLSDTGDVFTRDDDPELIRDATPFALKLYESLLESVPNHVPLLIATCSSFTQYGYAFLEAEADGLDASRRSEARRCATGRSSSICADAATACERWTCASARARARRCCRIPSRPWPRPAKTMCRCSIGRRRRGAPRSRSASTGPIWRSTFRPCGRSPIARWPSIRDGARARSTS